MTKAPALDHEIEIELSDEESEMLTARAKTLGLDLEAYLRVRVLTAEELPEPAAFFDLFRRLGAFAKDYERCIQAIAAPSNTTGRIEELGKVFAQLLQDWDQKYGPRHEDLELLSELAEPLIDLPPRDEAEANQRALQEINTEALFADLKLPPETDHAAVRKIVKRQNELIHAHNDFLRETAETGVVDRAKFRQLLEDIRQARREFLIAIGQDPDSEELLSLTAHLHDA
jgi:hypothetical protein